MNLNIDEDIPAPPAITSPYLLTYIPTLQALLLYSTPQIVQPVEEPNKKKFAFKANNNTAPTSQDIFLYLLSSKTWKTVPTKGKFPTKRQNPAVAFMNSSLMVYGGRQINPYKVVSDLYCLNVTSWQWKKLFVMQTPPAFENLMAFCLNDDNLLLIGKECWVFSGKGVNWQLQKGDLPGGIWQKLQINLPFQIKCSHKISNNQILIFGYQQTLQSALLNIQQGLINTLLIESQIKDKIQKVQICLTTEGQALIINGSIFYSILVDNQQLIFRDSIINQHIQAQYIIHAQHNNYAINQQQQIFAFQLIVDNYQHNISEEDEEAPDTTRHVENAQQISVHSIVSQPKSVSNPYNQSQYNQSVSNPLSAQLLPLLAKECFKRRILQEKGKLLQGSIKKAQKIVLALCGYGSEQQKREHITKVRSIRQNLYSILKRESYLRKQMLQRPGQNQLKEHAIQQEEELIQYINK